MVHGEEAEDTVKRHQENELIGFEDLNVGGEQAEMVFKCVAVRMFYLFFLAINTFMKEPCGTVIYTLFTAFSLDIRKDAMADFLPLRQEMTHHIILGSHQAQNTANLESYFWQQILFFWTPIDS